MAFSLSGILSLNANGFLSGINKSQKAVDGLGSKVSSVGGGVKKFGGVLAGIGATVGLTKIAKDSIMLASSLVEVQNVVDTTFGKSASQINDFSKTASSQFGLTELQAKQFNGVLGAIMKSSGLSGKELSKMSMDLTGLAGDMASFYNLKPEEAFEKLKSAIGGETEPMKALGVNMSVANLETSKYVKTLGKQWKNMSQSEQTMARYSFLMEATKDAQGDFNKTGDTFANQLRQAENNFKSAGASIGSLFLPKLNEVLKAFNGFMSSNNIQWVTNKLTDLGNKVSNYVTPYLKEIGDKAYSLYQKHAPDLAAAFDSLKTFAKDLADFGLWAVKEGLDWFDKNKETVTTAIGIVQKGFEALSKFLSGDLAGAIGKVKDGLLDIGKLITEVQQNWANSDNDLLRFVGQGAQTYVPSFGPKTIPELQKNQETFKKTTVKAWDQFINDPSLEGFGRFLIGTPKKNANGTSYFTGGLGIKNERGGEMSIDRSGTAIIPADRTKEMLEGNSNKPSQNITINIDARGISVDELVSKLQSRLNVVV